jgi:hypothetical protein
MKKIVLLTLASVFLFSVNAQTFNKTIGIEGLGLANECQTIQTLDGGFASIANISNDILLVKTNSVGDTLWTKIYGGTGQDIGSRLIQTSTGDLYIGGYTSSFSLTGNYFIKTNSAGTILWSKVFTPGTLNSLVDMNITGDDGFIMLNSISHNFVFTKVSPTGTIEFSTMVLGSAYDVPYAVIQVSDGGYLGVGTTDSYAPGGGYDAYLVKLDAAGALSWEKTHGGAGSDVLYDVLETSSGRFVMTGYTTSAGEGESDIYFLETYNTGALYIDRVIGRSFGNDFGFSIKNSGTNYYILGSSKNEEGDFKTCFLKLPSGTSVSWAKIFNTSNYNNPKIQLCLNTDDSFCFSVPNMKYSPSSHTEINVIKTDADGNSGACDDELKYFAVMNPTFPTGSGGSTTAGYNFTNTTVTTEYRTNSFYHIVDNECNPNKYQKTIAYDGLDCSHTNIFQTTDNGYLMSTEPWDNDLVQSNQSIVKLNYDGEVQWSKKYTWDYLNSLGDVIQTSDGGYLVTGYTTPDEDSDDRGFVTKVNNTGEVQWSKRYGGTVNNEDITVALELRNSTYLFGGKTDNYGYGVDDFYIINTDASGNQLWSKTYGELGYQEIQDMIQTYDGGFLIAGLNGQSGAGSYDIQLTKTDASGNITWSRIIGTSGLEFVRSIIQTNDGGYLMSGKSGLYAFISKLTSTGTISWTKTYSVISDGNMVIQDNYGYLLAGFITNVAKDGFLSKFDFSGNLLWTKAYGSTSDDIFNAVDKVNDGGYILSGFTYNFTDNFNKSYIVKTDENGHSSDCHESDLSLTVSNLTFTNSALSCSTTSNNGTASAISVIVSNPSNTVENIIPDLSYLADNVNCFGGNDGSINVTVDGGGLPINYSWSTGYSGQDLSGLAQGTYSLTIIDDYGCVLSETVEITQPTLLTASTSSTNVTCHGGTNGTGTVAPMGGTPPYSYYWSNGGVTSTITNLYPATFFINVVDANGCAAATNSITISQPQLMSASVTGTDVTCYGDSDGDADLSLTGGTSPYSYTWTGGFITQDLSNVPAGTYFVTVTDACSDHVYQTVTLVQPDQLEVSPLSYDVSCYGGTDGQAGVIISGGKSPYNYLWSTGASTSTISSLSQGSYMVTVGDACSDQVIENVTVFQPEILDASVIGTDVSCYGYGDGYATVNATGGTIPYLYSWSNGQHTQTAVGLFPATYIINVVDANGCLSSDIVSIGQPSEIELNINSQNASCGNENGEISVDVSGGNTPYSYLWSNGAEDEIITGISEGTYSLTVTDFNGCQQYDAVNISVAAITVPVCIVTVDPESGRNLVVWEKTTDQQIAYYNVYKQSYTGEFDYLASIDYDSQSICLDGTSDPQIHSDKYKITVVDTCGNESAHSSHHKTLHLNVSPATMSSGYALTWGHYEGFPFTTYRIFRGTNPSNLVQIDSIAYDIGTFTYTDVTAASGIQYFYQVAAVKPGESCLGSKDISGPYSQSVSNLEDNGISVGINSNEIIEERVVLYPNPFRDEAKVEFNNSNNTTYQVSIYEVSGKIVRKFNVNNSEFSISKTELAPGYYSLEISGEKVFRTRFVIQ